MRKWLLVMLLCCVAVPFLMAQSDMELANEYYAGEEYEKAISYYNRVLRDRNSVFEIHKNYLDALLKLQQYDEAEKYLKRQLRIFPSEAIFNIDLGVILNIQRKYDEATRHYETYINQIKKDENLIRNAGRAFINNNLFEYAEQLYLAGRKLGSERFTNELISLYSIWGKLEKLSEELMEMLVTRNDDGTVEQIQAILQSRVKEEEDILKLEPVIMRYVQKYPEQIVFNQMLYWYYLQLKDFNKALTQAKAIDRRLRLMGDNIFRLGRVCLENKEYSVAIKSYEYLVERYRGFDVQISARKMLTQAKEMQAKSSYPVDLVKIRLLANDYIALIKEYGMRNDVAEAVRNLAQLQAFYLQNKDTAITLLEGLSRSAQASPDLVAKAKLDLGDIYLLKGEHWESTLLYAQVEKSERTRNVGISQMAKLRNAKLAYYKGEFEFAKEYLDILKIATDREIANDAMQLSLLIGDNLELDTSELAMREYASADLLIFQGKLDEALDRYSQMLKTFPGHSLTDEIYYAKASLLMRMGKFEPAIEYLERILNEYGDDILADDANYQIGLIYEENLKDKARAMEYYKQHLIKFPGSIFTSDARRRFRVLRGDAVN